MSLQFVNSFELISLISEVFSLSAPIIPSEISDNKIIANPKIITRKGPNKFEMLAMKKNL